MSTTSSQTYTDIVSQGNSDPISNYDGNIYVVKSYEDKGVQVPDLSEELSQDNIDKDSSEIYISENDGSGDTFWDEYTCNWSYQGTTESQDNSMWGNIEM